MRITHSNTILPFTTMSHHTLAWTKNVANVHRK